MINLNEKFRTRFPHLKDEKKKKKKWYAVGFSASSLLIWKEGLLYFSFYSDHDLKYRKCSVLLRSKETDLKIDSHILTHAQCFE